MSASRHLPETADPRDAAFRILLRVERAGAFADVLLDRAAGGISDPRDAALLREIVLGVLRRRSALDHAIAGVSRRPPEHIDAETAVALRIGAYSLLYLDRVPGYAAVDRAVELVKRNGRRAAAGFVNGVLRELARGGASLLPPPAAPGDPETLALEHSHPVWWVRRLVARLGEDEARRTLEAQNRPAAPVLRPNLRVTSAARLRAELVRDGFEVEPCAFVPDALRVTRGALRACRALGENRTWVQDEASQLVTTLFGGRPALRRADLCAAPGGKSMHWSETLPDDGVLVAVDRHRGRLRRMQANLRRLGVPGIHLVQADMTAPIPPLRGPFDAVLVDAPCSGSGTFRRHPEIRWRLRDDDLKVLAVRQQRILRTAADLLAPGGRLVYAVCSMEPEEGQHVIGSFLDSRPEFETEDPRPGMPPAARRLVDDRGFLRTSPADGGLDGFFAALVTRRDRRDARAEART